MLLYSALILAPFLAGLILRRTYAIAASALLWPVLWAIFGNPRDQVGEETWQSMLVPHIAIAVVTAVVGVIVGRALLGPRRSPTERPGPA